MTTLMYTRDNTVHTHMPMMNNEVSLSALHNYACYSYHLSLVYVLNTMLLLQVRKSMARIKLVLGERV